GRQEGGDRGQRHGKTRRGGGAVEESAREAKDDVARGGEHAGEAKAGSKVNRSERKEKRSLYQHRAEPAGPAGTDPGEPAKQRKIVAPHRGAGQMRDAQKKGNHRHRRHASPFEPAEDGAGGGLGTFGNGGHA